jgi:hypothetical protein
MGHAEFPPVYAREHLLLKSLRAPSPKWARGTATRWFMQESFSSQGSHFLMSTLRRMAAAQHLRNDRPNGSVGTATACDPSAAATNDPELSVRGLWRPNVACTLRQFPAAAENLFNANYFEFFPGGAKVFPRDTKRSVREIDHVLCPFRARRCVFAAII